MANLRTRLDRLEKFKDQDSMTFLVATNGVLEDGRKIEDLTGNHYIMDLVDDSIVLYGSGVKCTMPTKKDRL